MCHPGQCCPSGHCRRRVPTSAPCKCPFGVQQWNAVASGCPSLHPAELVPTWAGGRAGRDKAEIKLLMSPSVTRPPITQAGIEEMMEGDVAGGGEQDARVPSMGQL